MARLSHQVEYLFALMGTRLAQAMSARLADRFGSGLGGLAGKLLASRGRIAADNLRRAMGEELSEQEIADVVREVFRNAGRTSIETARMCKILQTPWEQLVSVEGEAYLERVRSEGRGAMMVTAHFGNWELLGAWTAGQVPTDFLVGVQHNQKVDDLINGFRKEIGVGLIPVSSPRGVLRSLKQNRVVAVVSDQHAPSGVIVDFFGRRASTPKGPATFAVRAGCPIVPMVLRRDRYDRFVVLAGEPIYPPDTGNATADVETMTDAYTRYFEACIRRHPEQWLWTHRRWKVD